MRSINKVVPWGVARFLLVIGLVAVISVGVALIAHGIRRPHPCPRACQTQYAWMKFSTAEIVGVGVGVGVCLYGAMSAARVVCRLKRTRRITDATHVE